MTRRSLSRRGLIVGGGAAAALTAGAGLSAWSAQSQAARPSNERAVEPFFGEHQAGIATAPQAHAMFLAVDLLPGNNSDTRAVRENLKSILRLWTTDAARLTQGVPALADTEPELATSAARLTVTAGLGPSAFAKAGLTDRCPASARDFPAFATDRLDKRWCGGDLLLQICADDMLLVAHTARVLLKNVRSLATERWRQTGFRTPRAEDPSGGTMRNLMGQVDGTVNPGAAELDSLLWHQGEDHQWLRGGTLLVLRRITMNLDGWDQLDRKLRDLIMGRRSDNGSPLTGDKESDEPDLTMTRGGIPVIPATSHIALARHRNPHEKFLRRPYNFDDAPLPGTSSNSGLIFAAYQRDIATQFVPVQQRLSEKDEFNQWNTAVGSAVFVMPPGTAEDGYLGRSLLD
ncbi:Dyp-type peroxidase [Mycobacteroides franklinii]|uniref:Dyp-type peroxidase n=1 Tax=Mycobacteroides franklinii TaxID=948102 RepID=A0A4R8RCB3_9MYCO|nr:Dyp-type peroxidase [Mycobacteroides franklinii]ORA58242.1 peroxidase [Mycobacteroides franklinii]TDH24869.1 Dyp-type peroxidase [Mycobacteroides franklinii]TDZ42792.1 putative deferrochelatase/peroxidase EfeN precursor [Mycobacteroides franklinii]TDZ52940.1 putative deferrochelatase/peroxidase EfeN precursor [Mycobacteroides franklinii]TDZ56347.1 putative deferrochelatase/peroxidase EfeN precursor [Mycobacteroides franklinii]